MIGLDLPFALDKFIWTIQCLILRAIINLRQEVTQMLLSFFINADCIVIMIVNVQLILKVAHWIIPVTNDMTAAPTDNRLPLKS